MSLGFKWVKYVIPLKGRAKFKPPLRRNLERPKPIDVNFLGKALSFQFTACPTNTVLSIAVGLPSTTKRMLCMYFCATRCTSAGVTA